MADERYRKVEHKLAAPVLGEHEQLLLKTAHFGSWATRLERLRQGAHPGARGRPKLGNLTVGAVLQGGGATRREGWARWWARLRSGLMLVFLSAVFAACGPTVDQGDMLPDSERDAASEVTDGTSGLATADGDAGGEIDGGVDILDETDLSADGDLSVDAAEVSYQDAAEVSHQDAAEVSDQDAAEASWSSFDSLGFGVVASSGRSSGRRLVGGFSPIAGQSTSNSWSVTGGIR